MDNLLEFAKVQKLLEADPTLTSKQKAKLVSALLKDKMININGKNRPHQDSTPKPSASTASKRIDVCHRAHLATPSMDAGFTSALRDPTATFAVSFLRPRALNFDKVCQTVNQSAQIAQQRISKSILDSMTTLSSMPTMWLCSLAQLRKRLAA